MKVRNLVGERFKEKPSDAVFDSHAFMVRGGYIKYVGNGIYSQLPQMKRISSKIEQIIREEMDRIDGQEVLLPVTMPSTLWEESGRYESVGKELLRFNDRNNSKMILGMTHEEAAVQLVREYANTYTRYPFMIYQIQTKFRDEARPRAGLIRVREFTMKDAYSFHTSQSDLEDYYQKCLLAYNRIYARAGIPEVACVRGDSGMMGGAISHEFMLLTPMGEDSLAVCDECDFKSNVEACECIIHNEDDGQALELEKVHTPDIHSMEDLEKSIGVSPSRGCKAVVYELETDSNLGKAGELVIAFIRGDLELNETKLYNVVGQNIIPANLTDDSPVRAGFIGPIGLKTGNGIAKIVFDKSLDGISALTCGANEVDYHYKNMNIARDVGDIEYVDIATIIEGSICPKCGKKSIKIARGIEVGNIFQLGTKYSEPMHLEYTDEDGKTKPAIMGCYGIGVGRLAASVCESHHDDYGPIWPISIAPWEVQICLLRSDDVKAKDYADKLYDSLLDSGVEVLYDDRDVRPGAMFNDADLFGVPIRVIVSPRNMENSVVEIKTRDKKIEEQIKLEDALQYIIDLKKKLFDEINSHVID